MSKTETPDIVTMLQTAINDRGKGSVWGYAGLLEDATAEIERLRTELAKQSQWPVLHRRHKGASMTHPLPDKAVEAGARAIARLVPCGDGSRWTPNHGNGFPSEYSAVEQRLIRSIAKEAIEAALAAEGLVVVKKEEVTQ